MVKLVIFFFHCLSAPGDVLLNHDIVRKMFFSPLQRLDGERVVMVVLFCSQRKFRSLGMRRLIRRFNLYARVRTVKLSFSPVRDGGGGVSVTSFEVFDERFFFTRLPPRWNRFEKISTTNRITSIVDITMQTYNIHSPSVVSCIVPW